MIGAQHHRRHDANDAVAKSSRASESESVTVIPPTAGRRASLRASQAEVRRQVPSLHQ